MPNLQNAVKALRQAKKRAVRNKARTSAIDHLRRDFRKSMEAGKLDEAKSLSSKIYQAVDKAAGKGIIKKNAAARMKSRLMGKMHKTAAK